jgi:hypothetical protein
MPHATVIGNTGHYGPANSRFSRRMADDLPMLRIQDPQLAQRLLDFLRSFPTSRHQ